MRKFKLVTFTFGVIPSFVLSVLAIGVLPTVFEIDGINLYSKALRVVWLTGGASGTIGFFFATFTSIKHPKITLLLLAWGMLSMSYLLFVTLSGNESIWISILYSLILLIGGVNIAYVYNLMPNKAPQSTPQSGAPEL